MQITIKVMSTKGDNRFQYDSELQLEEATKKFVELKEANFSIFCVDPETKESTLVEELFPAPQFVAVPQLSGG